MNEGVSGWYGLMLVLLLAGIGLVIASVLGAAALRLMLKDETYFPEEH